MRAELAYLAPSESFSWALGFLAAACKLRVTEPAVVYAACSGSLATMLILIDWHVTNDMLTVGVLVLAASALGFLRPDRTNMSWCMIGLTLLAAHAFANFTGWLLPFYQCKPLISTDFVVLASLVVPAFAGTKAGANLRAILGK